MTTKRLYRSHDQMVGGVCAGVAEYFAIDPTLVRLVFAALTLFGVGSPVLVYLLLWVIIPEAPVEMPQQRFEPQSQQPTYPSVEPSTPMAEADPAIRTNHAEPKLKEPVA
jgi:phage shock protein PspC (stress-responsive transcriptional regulator)